MCASSSDVFCWIKISTVAAESSLPLSDRGLWDKSKMENATVTGSSTDLPMHLVKDSLYVKLN